MGALEGETITLLPDAAISDPFYGEDYALAFARIENHYFVNAGWMAEGQLIRDAEKLRDIPGVIVQGRYDIACPPQTGVGPARGLAGSGVHHGRGRRPRAEPTRYPAPPDRKRPTGSREAECE